MLPFTRFQRVRHDLVTEQQAKKEKIKWNTKVLGGSKTLFKMKSKNGLLDVNKKRILFYISIILSP